MIQTKPIIAFILPHYPKTTKFKSSIFIPHSLKPQFHIPPTITPLKRATIFAVTDDQSSSQPSDVPNSSTDNKTTSTTPSRTLVGRIIVEVFSLLTGAILLLVVVAWRFSQVLSLNIWRAMLWLSNVRQLGKWAMTKLTNTGNLSDANVSLFQLAQRTVHGLSSILSKLKHHNQKTMKSVSSQQDIQKSSEMSNTKFTDLSSDDVHPTTARVVDSIQQHDNTVSTSIPLKGRRLILLRHAKTLWERNSETPDHDRVLSAVGKEEARLVGGQLAKMTWFPDMILCSDAIRTVQTLNLLDISNKKVDETLYTESIYFAVTGNEMAMAVDKALGKDGFKNNTTLMVVCHNPGCEELVEQLTGHRPNMGTACAALMEYGGIVEDEEDQKIEEDTSFSLISQKEKWNLVELIRPAALQST